MRPLILTVTILLFSSGAFAGPCAPGTLLDYINLGDTGCTSGLALFNHFYEAPGQAFAIPIPADQVLVTPGGGPFAPLLLFTLNKPAMAGELFESFFHFDVSASDLRSATMILGGSSATGDGAVIASADICANGFFDPLEPTGCPGSQSLITFVTALDSGLTDSRAYTLTSFFDIFVDLTVDGGLNGTASLGSATFQVAAVPEPATAVLLIIGCGVLALGRFRRHL